jgi:hypothetical protein
MKLVKWCVCHGVDRSHMFDVVWFTKLKDARSFVKTLLPSPIGFERSWKIQRVEFNSDFGTECVTFKDVESNC